MELFRSRLLTVRLCCGRQDLAVLPLYCTSLVHFLSSVCCVLFSFCATSLDSSRITDIFENLVHATAGLLLEQRPGLYRGYIYCSTSGGGRWGLMSCKLVLETEHVFTTFQMAEKCNKSLGTWSFCCWRCNKVITLLSCMPCVFDFQFLGEFLRD